MERAWCLKYSKFDRLRTLSRQIRRERVECLFHLDIFLKVKMIGIALQVSQDITSGKEARQVWQMRKRTKVRQTSRDVYSGKNNWRRLLLTIKDGVRGEQLTAVYTCDVDTSGRNRVCFIRGISMLFTSLNVVPDASDPVLLLVASDFISRIRQEVAQNGKSVHSNSNYRNTLRGSPFRRLISLNRYQEGEVRSSP